MSDFKPLIDPEWSARFVRDLERMVEQARRDARRAGEQMSRALAAMAKMAEK